MVYKLTLDGGILREVPMGPAVRTLKLWETEGKIELFESDRAKDTGVPAVHGWPGAPRRGVAPGRVRAVKEPPGGPGFQSVSVVLFPGRDPHRLSMTQVNSVAHLLRHHTLGHSLFITNNKVDFINEGKRERLQALFKIMILTPDEAIQVLRKSNEWPEAPAGGDNPSTKRGVR